MGSRLRSAPGWLGARGRVTSPFGTSAFSPLSEPQAAPVLGSSDRAQQPREQRHLAPRVLPSPAKHSQEHPFPLPGLEPEAASPPAPDTADTPDPPKRPEPRPLLHQGPRTEQTWEHLRQTEGTGKGTRVQELSPETRCSLTSPKPPFPSTRYCLKVFLVTGCLEKSKNHGVKMHNPYATDSGSI